MYSLEKMWQLTCAIIGVFYTAHRAGILEKILYRPRYVPRKGILRYIVEYPTLSFIAVSVVSVIPAVAMGSCNAPKTDSLPRNTLTFSVLAWLCVCEELLFRGVIRSRLPRNWKAYMLSGVMYGTYYTLLTGIDLPQFLLFSLLGTVYGFGAEKYSVAELILFKTGLFSVALLI